MEARGAKGRADSSHRQVPACACLASGEAVTCCSTPKPLFAPLEPSWRSIQRFRGLDHRRLSPCPPVRGSGKWVARLGGFPLWNGIIVLKFEQ